MATHMQGVSSGGGWKRPNVDVARQFDQDYQSWASRLTESEKAALVVYRTPGQYFGINHFARNGELPQRHAEFSSLTREQIRDELIPNLDSAIEKAPRLVNDTRVYRVLALPESLAGLRGALAGKVLDEPAFMSTTLSRGTAIQFELKGRRHPSPPVLLEVELPKGTRAAYIEASLQRNPRYPDRGFTEQEILVARGHQLRFTSDVEVRDGIPTVRARLESPAAQPRDVPQTSSSRERDMESISFFDVVTPEAVALYPNKVSPEIKNLVQKEESRRLGEKAALEASSRPLLAPGAPALLRARGFEAELQMTGRSTRHDDGTESIPLSVELRTTEGRVERQTLQVSSSDRRPGFSGRVYDPVAQKYLMEVELLMDQNKNILGAAVSVGRDQSGYEPMSGDDQSYRYGIMAR